MVARRASPHSSGVYSQYVNISSGGAALIKCGFSPNGNDSCGSGSFSPEDSDPILGGTSRRWSPAAAERKVVSVGGTRYTANVFSDNKSHISDASSQRSGQGQDFSACFVAGIISREPLSKS